jgi:uncharacterized protein DUF2442
VLPLATPTEADLPASVRSYIARFDEDLTAEELNSDRFAFRMLFVPKLVGKKGQADEVIDRPTPMNEIIQVTDVQPLEGHRIRVTFTDGAIKEIDLSALLAAGGVFAPIYERRELFEQVAVNPESRTVEWPGEVDLDPEVLYGRYDPASGHRIERRTVREPATAAK